MSGSVTFLNQSQIQDQEEDATNSPIFAGIYHTWIAIRDKFHEMWTTCCFQNIPEKYQNYDGFSDDDSQSHTDYDPTTPSPDDDENLTPAQQMTLFALVTVPPLALALLLLLCVWWCRKLRDRVPSYLSSHFPLYNTEEESRVNTPVLGRRTISIAKLDVLQPTIVNSSECTTIINWSSKE